ncbi:Rmf/CrpP fold protein [Kitasatospora sp. NPDC090091]|uniref:Rmf/CrpP fold protein n=1 Tax=Kitasatospora sp. NPDC090091 TaxID=3364081 RepID=UPI00382A4C8B
MEAQDLPGRGDAVRALAEGAKAAAAGKDVSDCPYPADGNFGQRYRRRFWTRGFNGAGTAEAAQAPPSAG